MCSVSKRGKYLLPYDPQFFSGIFLKEISSDVHQKTGKKMFIVALFIRVTHLETLKGPSTGPMAEYHAGIKTNIVMSGRSQIKIL